MNTNMTANYSLHIHGYDEATVYQEYCNTYLIYSFSFYGTKCESVAAVYSQPSIMPAPLVYQLCPEDSTVREKKPVVLLTAE
jgi:hypothetical protein